MYNVFMDIIYILYIFMLGAVVGSFLNVVALRYNSGLSIKSGRSKCFSCNRVLEWFELVPLFSFLFIRAKCRTCKTPISWRYFIVELITGIMFVGVAIRQYNLWPVYNTFDYGLVYSLLFFIFYTSVFSLLLVITLYDIRHKIIPDEFVYTFIILGAIKLGLFFYLKDYLLITIDYFDALAAFIIPLPFAVLWFISDGRWIGFGDIKLMFGMGILLGFVGGVSSVILAFWTGALWGIFFILKSKYEKKRNKKVNFQSEVPFAPFLILGTVITFFTHLDILSLRMLFNI